METVKQDLAYGFRMLLSNPRFTLVAVLSLAIGIGANTAIFSVTNALLLKPLPYKDADRLVILWQRSPGLNVAQDWFSPGQYLDLKAENRVFEQLAATIDASYNLTGAGRPERVEGARVSSSLFTLFDVQPVLGRVFSSDEDGEGKPATAILSYGFWQRHFGGSKDVVGKSLSLNGNPVEIVGVMPEGFSLNKEIMPTVNKISNAELLLSLPMGESKRTVRTNEDYNIFGRLRSGVTLAQAQADVDRIVSTMKQQYPENYSPSSGFLISVVPLLQQVVGEVRRPLFILLGAVAFVLLIACANVANLQLSRGAARQKEIAVRAAVGAARARIIRQLLTENLLLSLIGGVLGLLFAVAGTMVLRSIGPNALPRLNEIGVDGRVLAFTFVVSVITGVLFGMAPALRSSKVDLTKVLKEGGRGSRGVGHHRLRSGLVVVEVALSVVLLIGAGLLVRSYRNIQNANPGFDPQNVLSFRLSLPGTKYKGPTVLSFYKQLTDKIKALPGVEAAGTSYSLPMSSVALAWGPITIEGYVPKNPTDFVMSNERFVGPGYFSALRVPLVKGRYFDERDVKGAAETVIVNENLAQRFWPNQDPIGRRLERGDQEPWRTVAGVVKDSKEFSVDNEPPISIYHPHEQIPIPTMFMVVRSSSDPYQLVPSINKEIQSLDPEIPAFEIKTMTERVSESLARRRFSTFLLGVFAVVALLLAVIGIYGVIAYSVTQRTQEIGIRMALGAEPSAILRMILQQSLVLVIAGIAIGLIAAFGLTRLMTSLLFGVGQTDLLAFAIPPVVLLFVALLASLFPARRAGTVNPVTALRSE
ncbi:MAG TPA: ABC transporter permease [Pyrinomonadaceae bacterium]|nr:ABC transporter permease [Pyrinomonadaceae bacterium]